MRWRGVRIAATAAAMSVLLTGCLFVAAAAQAAPAMPLAAEACAGVIAQADAEQVAKLVPSVATIHTARPQLVYRSRLDPGPPCMWVVVLEPLQGGRDVARIHIDATRGTLVRHHELPIGKWPPRMTAVRAGDQARRDAGAIRAARQFGGIQHLTSAARIVDGVWEVDFRRDRTASPAAKSHDNAVVMRVDVNDASGSVSNVWTGIQISWPMARGDRYAFGGDANLLWIWIPALILFALVMIDWRRWRSMYTLDVAAIVGFEVGLEAFNQARIDVSVVATAVVLVWLTGRMGWLYVRGVRPARRSPWPPGRIAAIALRPVPTVALVICCVLLAGLRIGINVEGSRVVDVGYAGVAGARLVLDGTQPWGNMPKDIKRGDTYGPVNYLAYVPAVVALDDAKRDTWGESLPAANATTIGADLICVLLLALIGWRWISRRAGALLALAWLTCPFTLWALGSNVNDPIVGALLLGAFAVLPRAWLRGVLIGLAAAVKFVPLIALAPALHVGARDRGRQAVAAIAGVALVAAACVAWIMAAPQGMHRFVDGTFGFQFDRSSPFSIWGMWGWRTAQLIAEGALLMVLVAACLRPRARDAWQVAAGMASVLFAVQSLLQHFTFLYLPWALGFVFIVLIAARETPSDGYAAAP